MTNPPYPSFSQFLLALQGHEQSLNAQMDVVAEVILTLEEEASHPLDGAMTQVDNKLFKTMTTLDMI